MPVGRTQPMYQLSKMNRNRATDSPTRTASARAIRWSSCSPSRRLRNMNTPAAASAHSTATNMITMMVFIAQDYSTAPSVGACERQRSEP